MNLKLRSKQWNRNFSSSSDLEEHNSYYIRSIKESLTIQYDLSDEETESSESDSNIENIEKMSEKQNPPKYCDFRKKSNKITDPVAESLKSSSSDSTSSDLDVSEKSKGYLHVFRHLPLYFYILQEDQ